MGNDDYKPMHNVTGGSLPAETWAAFMKVAHRNDDIPSLLGIPSLPAQIERSKEIAAQRQQDLAAEQATNATAAATSSAAKAAATPQAQAAQASKLHGMPAEARESIKRLANAFRLSAATRADDQPAAAPAEPPAVVGPPAPAPAAPAGKTPARDRRAEEPGAGQRAANSATQAPLRR